MWRHDTLTTAVVVVLGIALSAATAFAAYGYAGQLRIRNTSAYQTVELFIDGNPAGRIAPNVARNFWLQPGTHEVLVRDQRGRTVGRQVRISPTQTTVWRVDPVDSRQDGRFGRFGRLEVINRSAHHPVRIFIDDNAVGRIPPQQSRTFTVAPGSYRIMARDDRGSVLERHMHIGRHATETWQVGNLEFGQRDGWFEVINRSERHPVRISIDGDPGETIAPLQSRTFRLEPGFHHIFVRDNSGRSTEQRVRIRGGQATAWSIPPSYTW